MKEVYNKPIIRSLLDNDNYKYSMMNIIWHEFPQTEVEYRFKNRGIHKFNNDFLEVFDYQIKEFFPKSFSVPWI